MLVHGTRNKRAGACMRACMQTGEKSRLHRTIFRLQIPQSQSLDQERVEESVSATSAGRFTSRILLAYYIRLPGAIGSWSIHLYLFGAALWVLFGRSLAVVDASYFPQIRQSDSVSLSTVSSSDDKGRDGELTVVITSRHDTLDMST